MTGGMSESTQQSDVQSLVHTLELEQTHDHQQLMVATRTSAVVVGPTAYGVHLQPITGAPLPFPCQQFRTRCPLLPRVASGCGARCRLGDGQAGGSCSILAELGP